MIAQLGLCNGHQICPVIAGESHAAETGLPVRRCLQIGGGVAGGKLIIITGLAVDMLGKLTNQFPDRLQRFKAALRVLMGDGFRLAADKLWTGACSARVQTRTLSCS